MPGFNGCKLFGACGGGKLCQPDHPRHDSFLALPILPMDLPPGVDPADHMGSTCPMEVLRDPEVAWVLSLWADWTFYGESRLPFPGGVLDQPARATEALRVLSRTAQLQRAFYAEEAAAEAKRRAE